MDVSALTAAVSSGSAVFDILQLIVCVGGFLMTRGP